MSEQKRAPKRKPRKQKKTAHIAWRGLTEESVSASIIDEEFDKRSEDHEHDGMPERLYQLLGR